MHEKAKSQPRHCPICRVAMFYADDAWQCLHCGSSIGIAATAAKAESAEPGAVEVPRAAKSSRS